MKFKKGKFYRYITPKTENQYVVMCTEKGKKSKTFIDSFRGVIILPARDYPDNLSTPGYRSRFGQSNFLEVKLDIKIK